jgi:hypothetical protein
LISNEFVRNVPSALPFALHWALFGWAVSYQEVGHIAKAGRNIKRIVIWAAILTENGSLNPALSGQAVGATRNGVKCP